jgi:hypothetical protein
VRGLGYSIDPEHTGGRYASPSIADLVAIRTPNRNMTASNTFPALKGCPENDWITPFSHGGRRFMSSWTLFMELAGVLPFASPVVLAQQVAQPMKTRAPSQC